jgi:hypothetical protein
MLVAVGLIAPAHVPCLLAVLTLLLAARLDLLQRLGLTLLLRGLGRLTVGTRPAGYLPSATSKKAYSQELKSSF